MEIKKDMEVHDIFKRCWWKVSKVDGMVTLIGQNGVDTRKLTFEEFEELWNSSSLNPSTKEVVTRKEVYKVTCWWVDAKGNFIDNEPCLTYVVASSDEEVSQKMEVYKKQLLEKGCAELTWVEEYIVDNYYVID